MNEPDLDISAVTGVYTAFSYSLEGRKIIFCNIHDLHVRFDMECIRITDGFEYCQMGEMLIHQDETVSSTLKIYGGGLSYFPVGEGSISISQAVATYALMGNVMNTIWKGMPISIAIVRPWDVMPPYGSRKCTP